MKHGNPLHTVLVEAIAWCLPAGCLACGATLAAIAPFSVCLPCRATLQRRPRASCRTCFRELTPGGRYRCERCRHEPPAFDRLLSLWDYDEVAQAVVHGLKFGGLRYLGEHIADAIHTCYGREIGDIDSLVAVPLHPWRYLQRGYNQSIDIAKPLARRLGAPLERPLVRTRATPPQRRLDRSTRRDNLLGAFQTRPELVRKRRPLGARVLLIDDVVTTGATLEAASRALKRAGTEEVVALTAARTPRAVSDLP